MSNAPQGDNHFFAGVSEEDVKQAGYPDGIPPIARGQGAVDRLLAEREEAQQKGTADRPR